MAYIFKLLPAMEAGLIITIEVFILTLVLSIPLGIILALGRLSQVKLISKTVQVYIWVMRGTPLLLQLVFVFFGLPLVGIVFNRFTAVLLAFGLNYAAYFGEIIRGGIESVDKGQYDGAEVLGLTPFQTFIQIVLPQVIKRTLPAITNEVITLIKDTSLVYVVGIGELLRAGKIASNRDASLIPLVVVAIIYLLLTALLTKFLTRLEEGFAYYD